MFRVEVVSADGHACGIPIQLDDHPSEARPYALNAIADALLIDRGEILAVLKSATEAQLRSHLSQYTKEELKPPRMRSTQTARRPFLLSTRSA